MQTRGGAIVNKFKGGTIFRRHLIEYGYIKIFV